MQHFRSLLWVSILASIVGCAGDEAPHQDDLPENVDETFEMTFENTKSTHYFFII